LSRSALSADRSGASNVRAGLSPASSIILAQSLGGGSGPSR
jgi:hypothetical protein